ncbi:MAG: restriction endonuclease [Methylococcaceae bacterium]|nr:restriction endonuclease [Methylococcaceae bacterium]
MGFLNKSKSILSSASSSITDFAQATADITQEKVQVISKINVSNEIRNWAASLFVKALNSCSIEQDKISAINWLAMSRETLSRDNLSLIEKTQVLYRSFDSKEFATGVFRSVEEGFKNYKSSDLPLALKVSIPLTLGAGTVLGGSSVGIAGFGTAVGVPVLLVVFLGVSGITTILEAFLTNSEARNYISVITAMIAKDELLRLANQKMRHAMTEEIATPEQYSYRKETNAIEELLLSMDPYDFEKHVMSFFQQTGLLAWVTKKSNDAGIDGFARHSEGLILVQCKRNATKNTVGRPTIQQFKGVIEENEVWRGYIVTTSSFTSGAIDSATKNNKIILIGLQELIDWHLLGINLDTK